MVTQYEAQKLQRDMHRELNAGRGAVGNCAACLAFVALVTLVGPVDEPQRRTDPAAYALAAQTVPSSGQGQRNNLPGESAPATQAVPNSVQGR